MWFLIFSSGDGIFSESSRKPTGAVLSWRPRASELGNTLCEPVDHNLHSEAEKSTYSHGVWTGELDYKES